MFIQSKEEVPKKSKEEVLKKFKEEVPKMSKEEVLKKFKEEVPKKFEGMMPIKSGRQESSCTTSVGE